MTLELGDVIAQIGGAGGGVDAVPRRYVHDFGNAPIPVTLDGDFLTHEVPDVPEGATLVVTLEWAGPETGGPAVVLAVDDGERLDAAFGVAVDYPHAPGESGFLPVTVVTTASGGERGLLIFSAVAEGYTATKLTAIIIPAINEASA